MTSRDKPGKVEPLEEQDVDRRRQRPVRRFLILSTVALGALMFVAATSGKKPTPKHGKLTFVVNTTDNGSCGAPWANDTIKRTFMVKRKGDGSYTLTRRDSRHVRHPRQREPGRL
jgi:hypothetical protein